MQNFLTAFRCSRHIRQSTHNLIKHFPRCLCSKVTDEKIQSVNEITPKNDSWTPIYRFPHIIMARLLNRLKLYQTVFVIGALPTAIYMHHVNMTDTATINAVIGCVALTCGSLYVYTSIFRRIIGIISISEDKCFVKIAHLTFWGNRKDFVTETKNIVPLTDGQCNPKDVYVKVQQYNSDLVLYMSIRYGKILDKDGFIQVFGDYDSLVFKK